MREPSYLISCSHSLPRGGPPCRVARLGGTKSGRGASETLALLFRSTVWTAALGLPAERFECQTRFLPLPSAISSIERPVATDSGSASEKTELRGPPA